MPLATAQRVSELHPHQKKTKGSFDWDQKNGWTREWASFADFEAWLWEEQLTHTIEFTLSSTKMGKWLWTERRTCLHAPNVWGTKEIWEEVSRLAMQDQQQKDRLPLSNREQTLSAHLNHFGALQRQAQSWDSIGKCHLHSFIPYGPESN